MKLKDVLLITNNNTASLCGICADQPYEEEKAEKLKNGVMKLNEHNGVILACKKHPLFDYVLSTYKQDAQNDNRPIQRQHFYNREEAFENFATRSGLVDERKLFTETQLQLIHVGLVKLRTMDEEDMKTVGELINRVEEIVPELHREERKFDVSRLLDALSMGSGMER